MKAPDPIAITPEDAARLRKLDEGRAANMAFVEQVRVAGERRNAALIEEGRQVWTEIAKKYELDLNHISYNLNEQGDQLIAKAAQFE